MKTYLVAFLLAALVAVLGTPLARTLAPKLGAVDLPSGRRVNKKAIPRMGGAAILAGFLAPLVALYFYDNSVSALVRAEFPRTFALIGGAIAMAALGAVDDVRGVRAVHKLIVQTAIASVAYAGGFQIASVTLPVFGHLDMGVFAAPVTVLWIVGVVNAVNLMDGLDGLAAGVSFFVCVVSFVIGLLSHNILVCLLAVTLAGALAGFLFFNFNPATIFMGDTGSLTIGYILATSALLGSKGGTAVALLVPVLAMGVPILDTLLAIVRRMLERRPIFSPDKGHLHHRLLDLGLTHRRAVLAIYGFSLLFTGSAIVVYVGRAWQTGLALGVCAILVFVMVRILGIVQSRKKSLDRISQRYDQCTNTLRRSVRPLLISVGSARTRSDVFAALTNFAEVSALKYVGCEDSAGELVAGQFHWERSTEALVDADQSYLSAKYQVDIGLPDKSQLKFGWYSESLAVPAETAILLQLAADAVADKLRELHPDTV